jgi:alkaline phosphatase
MRKSKIRREIRESARLLYSWSSDGKGQAVHTASDVPISSYSNGSKAYELFFGVQQDTDVFFKLLKAVVKDNDD